MITKIVTLSNAKEGKYIHSGLALIGLSGTGPRLIGSSNDGLLDFTVKQRRCVVSTVKFLKTRVNNQGHKELLSALWFHCKTVILSCVIL